MKRIALAAAFALSGALCAGRVHAMDPWDTVGDDGPGSFNALHHGIPQGPHDFESPDGTRDEDWFSVTQQGGHSYEAMVYGGMTVWAYGACPGCGAFDRVDYDGTILVHGTNEGVADVADLAVRWIGEWEGEIYLRANAGDYGGDANTKYYVVLRETTYFLPRFNNSGSQVTILVIQNTLNRPNRGEIHFFDPAGNSLDVEVLSLPPRGVSVINTSQIPALAGRTGSALIAQLGGFGALAGKAVTTDPATGMALETQLSTLP